MPMNAAKLQIGPASICQQPAAEPTVKKPERDKEIFAEQGGEEAAH
jgi:hypothetical protein